MIRHKQQYRHDPANGTWGDCDRTTLACLLDMDRDKVPHFGAGGASPKQHTEARAVWLRRMGWVEMRVAYDGIAPCTATEACCTPWAS